MEPITKIDPNQLPEGFSTVANPNSPHAQQQQQQQMQQQQMNEQKQAILEQACDRQALARLGHIKLVKEQKATQVENMIVSLAMQGKLPGKITEAKLIEFLERGLGNGPGGAGGSNRSSESNKISIQRKKYAFDSDDEDDDDEDLL